MIIIDTEEFGVTHQIKDDTPEGSVDEPENIPIPRERVIIIKYHKKKIKKKKLKNRAEEKYLPADETPI